MRRFGYTMAIAIAIGFGFLFPIIFHLNYHPWLWATGAIFAFFAFVKPLWLGYIYVPWMGIAEVLGFINSRVILFVVFVLVFVPISVIMRIFGHDPMLRVTKDELESYRIQREIAYDPKNMERPF